MLFFLNLLYHHHQNHSLINSRDPALLEHGPCHPFPITKEKLFHFLFLHHRRYVQGRYRRSARPQFVLAEKRRHIHLELYLSPRWCIGKQACRRMALGVVSPVQTPCHPQCFCLSEERESIENGYRNLDRFIETCASTVCRPLTTPVDGFWFIVTKMGGESQQWIIY